MVESSEGQEGRLHADECDHLSEELCRKVRSSHVKQIARVRASGRLLKIRCNRNGAYA